MADGQGYTVTVRTGKDGTTYLRIRETPPARSRPARRLTLTFTEKLNMFKATFQKAFRFVSRRARA